MQEWNDEEITIYNKTTTEVSQVKMELQSKAEERWTEGLKIRQYVIMILSAHQMAVMLIKPWISSGDHLCKSLIEINKDDLMVGLKRNYYDILLGLTRKFLYLIALSITGNLNLLFVLWK